MKYLFIPLVLLLPGNALVKGAELSFNRDIRPILSDNCFHCHGFDPKKRKGNLRLDTAEGAYSKGKSDAVAIIPGKLDESEVWKRIVTTDEDDLMPPEKSHKSLTAEQKEKIKQWILQGAKYQKHWSFEAPAKPEVPATGEANPIDNFLLHRLKTENLSALPEAEKEVLIRRLTFDLTGLPPTLAEVDAFLAEQQPGAYERLVDRLLERSQYGENMARYWLDIARYGDTHGLHLDNERQMWAYRDWVVGAFNRNEPFDQFTIDQIAGDLLPNATEEQKVASGFNRCNVTTSEGGSINEEFIYRYAVDRTVTTMQTWLGVTAGCATCHDHKFDPITIKDFYSMYAFFHSAADPPMDGNALNTPPVLQLANEEQTKRKAALDARKGQLHQQVAEALKKVSYQDPALLTPPPKPQEVEHVWVEDDFPAGSKPQNNEGNHPLTWVKKDQGPVFSGERALKRGGKGLAQDFYQGGAAPFTVPTAARLFVNVFLDPVDPPEAVMIQFHTSSWLHRAVWGNVEAIPYGAINTTERFSAGELPSAGRWWRLEVEVAKLGLKPGTQITGIAFTIHGGTAFFDQLGVAARTDATADPAQSFLAWAKPKEGKDTQGLPAEINRILKTTAEKRSPGQQQQLQNYYLENVFAGTRADFDPLHGELAKIDQEKKDLEAKVPSTFIMADLPQMRESFVMTRGAYDKPGERVYRNVPAFLPPLPADVKSPTRLDLAKWLVSPDQPLTARVTVNRFWQQFFGIGLVKSAGDFGSQGEPPSHPELLDWLAVNFRDSGWDVKKLVRLMVTSSAYRRTSVANAAAWQADPENRLLARGARFRLDAEVLRDNSLALSGLLDSTMGGKGVRTYQPPNIWEPVGYADSNTRFYKQDHGSALYRRSLYVFLKRTAPPPFMSNFDAPSREQSCTRRERSNTPMQALQLLNDVQHFEAARVFAEKILLSDQAKSPEDRIALCYRTILSRKPQPKEVEAVKALLGKYLVRYQGDAAAAMKVISNGETKPKCDCLNVPELAAWTLVSNILMNLDETITRN